MGLPRGAKSMKRGVRGRSLKQRFSGFPLLAGSAKTCILNNRGRQNWTRRPSKIDVRAAASSFLRAPPPSKTSVSPRQFDRSGKAVRPRRRQAHFAHPSGLRALLFLEKAISSLLIFCHPFKVQSAEIYPIQTRRIM